MKAGLLLVAAASGALAAVVPRNDDPYSISDYVTTRSFTLPPVPIPTDLPTYPPAPSTTPKSSAAPSTYKPPPPSSTKKPAPSSSTKKPVPSSSTKKPVPSSTKKPSSAPVSTYKPASSSVVPPKPSVYPSDSIGLSVRAARATTTSKKATTSTAKTTVKTSSSAKPSSPPSSTKPPASAPTSVEIIGVTYGGTGCPANSVGSAINSDRSILTLIFDQYVATIGGGAKITESRKNCQLNVQLLYPGGFQYSVLSAAYRGYAYLDPGITGKQTSTYYFSGQSAQASTGTTWNGPYAQNYLVHDTAISASNVWSPCGEQAMLNVNSQIALTSTNSTGQGLLTNDSIDLNFQQQIYIQWRACTN